MTRASPDAARSKSLILAAIFLVAVTIPISFTGPAVALRSIGEDLGGSVTALAWIINGFMLAVGSSVMLGGALADQYGRKKIFTIGITGFTLVSLAIGLAPNVLTLDLLRGLQGISGALALSAGFAALAQEFEGPARTRALGLIGSGFGIGIAFGPIIAGGLIATLGWRAIFFISAAAGVLILAIGVPQLRETRDPGATRIDGFGAATFTAMLVTLTFGLVEAPELGWAHPLVIGLLAFAAIFLIVFIAIERLQVRPMLDLSLFRYARFVGVQALPVAVAYSFVVPLFLLPIRFIRVEGYSELQAGLMMLPLSAPIAIVPFLAANLTRWVPSGMLAAGGLVLSAIGIAWLAAIAPGASTFAFVLPLLLVGTGAGMPWGLMDDLAISVVPTERAGMATGIFGTMRVAGETVAIAVISAVLAGFVGGGLAGQLPDAAVGEVALAVASGAFEQAATLAPGLSHAAFAAAYGHAFHMTMLICGTITFAAALITFVALKKPRPARKRGRGRRMMEIEA
ncbi:MFS transporter [Kaistia dalseonensis]|uniref:MFS family permease n=1 Tax=Kaistia dalseonensis TaxID=410840 RepID=A0ABU0HC48_9HYPH|nr:MFS transporter [Kaistia dalseonensis]MCX5496472.1 MFS transporter [Kaistia dalseonensis]MDQ0439094.1 MFS family permease [Kaistia dalseonensis]